MRKSLLWTAIGASIFAIINLIVYTVLACNGVVEMRMLAYLFMFGYLVCSWIPFLLNVIFKTQISNLISISYQVFLICSMIVGSLWRVYGMWEPYDNVVHTSSGVLIALIAYWFFANGKKNSCSLFWIFVITFSVAMMCGGVWEIWEFVTDGIFGNNGQVWQGLSGRAALMDTMTDIICDCCGGIAGAVAAVILEWKSRKKKESQTNENVQIFESETNLDKDKSENNNIETSEKDD